MKKFLTLIFCIFAFNANAMEKETTFNLDLFDKAQSEGKIVIVSSWIEYCSSCAGQMKILKKAKIEGKLSDINFDDIEYFAFDVTNEKIADLFIESKANIRPINCPTNLNSSAIDEFLLIFLIAAKADGISFFKGLSELNQKESPRLLWGSKILNKMGVKNI